MLLPTVNKYEAKSQLSRLVEALATSVEQEIIIARNGRPVARLVPIAAPTPGPRIGIARGKLAAPSDINAHDNEIAALLRGEQK